MSARQIMTPELFLGPSNGYSYSSGGAGYLQGYPFDTTPTVDAWSFGWTRKKAP